MTSHCLRCAMNRVTFFASSTAKTYFYNDFTTGGTNVIYEISICLDVQLSHIDRIVLATILFKVFLATLSQNYAIFWQIGHGGHMI